MIKSYRSEKDRDERKIAMDYLRLFSSSPNKELSRRKVLLNLGKKNFWSLIYSSFVFVIQALPTWIMPIVTANIINIATDVVSKGIEIKGEILYELILNVSVLFVSIVQNIPSTMWRSKIVSKMLRNTSAEIKIAVVSKLQSLSMISVKNMETGRIQSKFLKDTDTVDSFLNIMMFSVIPNVISVIVAAIIAIVKNFYVSFFFIMIIPANVLLKRLFERRIRSVHHDFRVKTENMSANLTTMIEMMPVTKAHGLEKIEIDSADESINNLKGSGLKMDKTLAGFGAASWVVSTSLSAFCLTVCIILALYNVISIGEVVLFQSLFSTISSYVNGLINILPMLSSGSEALVSVSELMNITDVEDNTDKKVLENIEGNVDFENAHFKFPGANIDVIEDFSLSVKKGECIAFVGSSGSGKTTAMNMIIGFLLPHQGDVKIDGQSMKDINLSSYRKFISVVPQNSILFSGSIRDNITYGLTKYSEEDLQRVIDMANINEFLKELPDGLDTLIGEHGDKLSGGQKQRITIARALIRNPKILILDEATSALDNISEYQVQKAIEKSVKGRTTFIVAHRLSTIRNADRIVVLDKGRCIETGTYEELMEKKGKFFELKALNEMNLKNAEDGLN